MTAFKIIISSKAQNDLVERISFVLNVSQDAAIKLSNDIYSAIETLSFFPEKNPVFEMPKSFPFVIRKQVVNKRYIILYSVENNTIVVYRILDARRKFDYIV